MNKRELFDLADAIIEHHNLNTESDMVQIVFHEKNGDFLLHTHVDNICDLARTFNAVNAVDGHVIIVYRDGTSIKSARQTAWEYEADPDYLVTISFDDVGGRR